MITVHPKNKFAEVNNHLSILLSSKVHDVRMMTHCGCVSKIFELSRDLELGHEFFCGVYWMLKDVS